MISSDYPTFIAESKWKRFPYDYKPNQHLAREIFFTFKTENPRCAIEFSNSMHPDDQYPHDDLSRISTSLETLFLLDPTRFSSNNFNAFWFGTNKKVLNTETNTIFMKSESKQWYYWDSYFWNPNRHYRQNCNRNYAIEKIQLFASKGNWEIFETTPKLKLEIAVLSSKPNSTVHEIELVFLNFMEIQLEKYDDYRDLSSGIVSRIGVNINNQDASYGKSFIDPKKFLITFGESIFGPYRLLFKYRLRPRTPKGNFDYFYGDPLKATKSKRKLSLVFPPSASTSSYRQLYNRHQDYGWHEYFNYAMYHFEKKWNIRPATPNCSVVVQFHKLDIGEGKLVYDQPEVAGQAQQRLIVLRPDEVFPYPVEQDDYHWPICRHTIFQYSGHEMTGDCAYIGPKYHSKINSGLTIYFRSFYDFLDRGVSIGSGWEMSYWEVCNNIDYDPVEKFVVASVKISNKDWIGMNKLLPKFPSNLISPGRLFLDWEWYITPNNNDCVVEISDDSFNDDYQDYFGPLQIHYYLNNSFLVRVSEINRGLWAAAKRNSF